MRAFIEVPEYDDLSFKETPFRSVRIDPSTTITGFHGDLVRSTDP